jgi:serine/threonine-protein kinase
MLQPGHVLNGTYCVEQLLGSGGMADVYLVRHTRLPRQFALKLMLSQVAAQPGVRERFRQEAEILARLRHNHIVGVTDWDTTPSGRPYLVMDYIEGETLATFLRRTGPLSATVALDICRQIGEGLSAAHSAGVVHRDLKPSNIFLDKNGGGPNFVKILDFGIAKVMHNGQPLTGLHTGLIGTPGYMSPEQVTGGAIDHRCDQFALAIILFEMLTGRLPFCGEDDTALAMLARIVHEPAPTLPLPGINAALQRALSKSPEDRFPSIDALMSALFFGGRTGHGLQLTPVPSPSTDGNGELSATAAAARRLRLRRIVPGMALGIALGAVAVLAAAGWMRSHPAAALQSATSPSRPLPPSSPPPGPPQSGPPQLNTAQSGPPQLNTAQSGPPQSGPPQSDAPQSGTLPPSTPPTETLRPNVPPPAPVGPGSGAAPPGTTLLTVDRSKRTYSISVSEDSRFVGFNAPPAPAGAPTWVSVRLIQFCLEQKLKDVPLVVPSEIVLERTNTLKVTSPRLPRRRQELELCLAQQYENIHARPPRSVTIRVRYAP